MSLDLSVGRPQTAPVTLDRRFYLFMMTLIAALAVIGFAPNSTGIIAGAIPSPPLIVHIHAAVMTSWLLLLVAQAGLMSAGRRDLHMRLGLVAFGLVPAILVLGAFVTTVRYYDMAEAGLGQLAANILFLQARFFIMFPILIGWALAVRRRDPEMHKRLIIVAALLPMGAAFSRMAWIPGNDLMVTYDIAALIELAVLGVALAYDVVRRGRIHRAYVIGLAVTLPWLIVGHFLWNAAWWKAAADAFMGVA